MLQIDNKTNLNDINLSNKEKDDLLIFENRDICKHIY